MPGSLARGMIQGGTWRSRTQGSHCPAPSHHHYHHGQYHIAGQRLGFGASEACVQINSALTRGVDVAVGLSTGPGQGPVSQGGPSEQVWRRRTQASSCKPKGNSARGTQGCLWGRSGPPSRWPVGLSLGAWGTFSPSSLLSRVGSPRGWVVLPAWVGLCPPFCPVCSLRFLRVVLGHRLYPLLLPRDTGNRGNSDGGGLGEPRGILRRLRRPVEQGFVSPGRSQACV